MKKNLLSLCAVFMMLGSSLMAQNYQRCGSMEYLAEQKKADPGLEQRMADIEKQTQQWIANHANQRTTAVITIPVVFHVMYNTAAQNISDAQCQYQLQQLNADFARLNSDAGNTPSVWQSISVNTQVQFCLAVRDPNGNATSGIIHKSTSATSFSSNDNIKHNSTNGDDAWDRNSYLNIWTGNLSGGLLGYAQFPGGAAATDGVVFLYSSIGSIAHPGTAAPYNLGRTATHEIGHWLDLRHINGDGNCANDLVSDTPTQDQLHFGCFTHPYHANVCSGSSQGEMFMNYMDYTDDGCMNMFTAGQATRMQAALSGARASLQTSLGCTPPSGGSCNVPSGLNATSIASTTATLNWSAATGAVSYNVQYRIVGAGSWTSTTSATTSKAVTGLTASSNYEFQVQTVCSAASSAFSASGTFTTLSSGGGCSDIYESNNTRGTAKAVAVNSTLVGLITPSGDNDYFKFTTVAPNTNVQVTLTNLPADYELYLKNNSGTNLATSTNGGLTNEIVKYNTSTAATYNVRVFGYSGANNATQCYTLTIQTSSTAFKSTELTSSDLNQTEILSVYPNPVSDIMNVRFNSSSNGNITIKVIDVVGKNVMNIQKAGVKGNNEFEMNLNTLNKGVYFIEVSNSTDRVIKKIILN